MTETWPATRGALIEEQLRLGALAPPPWKPPAAGVVAGAVFVCFGRGGSGPGQPGDNSWASAATWRDGRVLALAIARGVAPAGYTPGLLALREGPSLEAAARALPALPDVLLVDATGRDHPRRAGLALHLGAVLGVPTVGVTHRPLVASGPSPGRRGDAMPLLLGSEVVGYLLRARTGTLPLAVHAAWRATPDVAREVVLATTRQHRTPEPLRAARQAAREFRGRTSH